MIFFCYSSFSALKYPLIRRDPNASTLKIHRLVHAVLKQGMDEGTQRVWAERVARAINLIFSDVGVYGWTVSERLLPRAYAGAELIKQWGFEFPEAARLLDKAGISLFHRACYNDAEPLYKSALKIREKRFAASASW